MNWKDLAEKVLPILEGGAKKLWDGPEDQAFLKECAEDAAQLSLRQLKGDQGLEIELEIVKETVRQRAMQKAIRMMPAARETFLEVLGVVVKTIRALVIF